MLLEEGKHKSALLRSLCKFAQRTPGKLFFVFYFTSIDSSWKILAATVGMHCDSKMHPWNRKQGKQTGTPMFRSQKAQVPLRSDMIRHMHNTGGKTKLGTMGKLRKGERKVEMFCADLLEFKYFQKMWITFLFVGEASKCEAPSGSTETRVQQRHFSVHAKGKSFCSPPPASGTWQHTVCQQKIGSRSFWYILRESIPLLLFAVDCKRRKMFGAFVDLASAVSWDDLIFLLTEELNLQIEPFLSFAAPSLMWLLATKDELLDGRLRFN